MYRSFFSDLLPLISNKRTPVSYFDYFKVIKVPTESETELNNNTSLVDKNIIGIAKKTGIKGFYIGTNPGDLFIFRDYTQINNEVFKDYRFVKYNYYDAIISTNGTTSHTNYLKNRNNYTTQLHSYEVDGNNLWRVWDSDISYKFLTLFDEGYLSNLLNRQPRPSLVYTAEQQEIFDNYLKKTFLDKNKINKIINIMFKFFKSIYNKISLAEPNSNDRNFFNSNLNVDRRQFFFGEIFKNIKKYKIISLLINDETSTKRTESMSIRSNYKNAYDSNSGLGLGEALVNSKDYRLLKEFNELKILCEVHHFLVLRNHTGVLYWYQNLD